MAESSKCINFLDAVIFEFAQEVRNPTDLIASGIDVLL